jgi:hypothetical protein
MAMHLYFSLIPEALIASMLEPEQFGQYYATGHKFKSKGQALFFEIDPSFRHEYFDIDGAFARCLAKADGTPKNSVYISMYRVMEHLIDECHRQALPDHRDGRDAGFEPCGRAAEARTRNCTCTRIWHRSTAWWSASSTRQPTTPT